MELKKIKLPFKVKLPVLAVGAQAKNTICFAEDNFAFLSPVRPDLSNPADFLIFRRHLKYFLKKRPRIIAYDPHPEYSSTKYAKGLSLASYQLSAIQHHHAHIASCMAENGLKNQKAIGIAFDGTGLGSDNRLWGAEFFICDYKDFKRVAHLKEILLLGAEKAILEPYRLVLAWFYVLYKNKSLEPGLAFLNKINKNKRQVLKKMYLSGFNSPPASSMGRLFDAAASLILGKYKAGSEAELAIRLEKLAAVSQNWLKPYGFRIAKEKKQYIINPAPVFNGIVADLKQGRPKEEMAYRFHLTVAGMIREISLILRKENRIDRIVLSGGVFQNNILRSLSLGLLLEEGFKIFTPQKLSCNDSAISLGQAAVANFSRPSPKHRRDPAAE